MKKNLICLLLATAVAGSAQATDNPLKQAIGGDHRADAASQRDAHRHPYRTLRFMGIEPDMTVIELWPGGGWYTDILAPYLKGDGEFVAAHFNPDSEHEYAEYFRRSLEQYKNKVDTKTVYGEVAIRAFEPGATQALGEPGSADMVLTFRNVHNWLKMGAFGDVLDQVHEVLKPGGVFGVVDHRADPREPIDPRSANGYVNERWIIGRIEAAGFRLVARSEVNANPDDHRNHPEGVWTLPPTLRHCRSMDEGKERDACMDRYQPIGESDRFTLRFVKVAR